MLDTLDHPTDAAGVVEAPAVSQSAVTGIAILGSHPATVERAPFADPSWLIYCCSPHNVEKRKLPRVDQWFEVHAEPHIEDSTRSFEYLKAVSEMPFVWMRDKRALESGLFKGARAYPDAEMKAKFCPFQFTSSIAYMLAKAITDCEKHGVKQIGLWGIMQASETEYCAVPETRALTADLRWVPVGDLKVGDELLAFDEYGVGNSRRQWRKAVVDATGIVKRDCRRIHMADGTRLTASFDHKWLNAEYQWVKSRDLRGGGDYPSASRLMKLVEPWPRDESWDAGYLAAAVDGEGCLTQFHNGNDSYQFRLSFAQRDNEMRQAVLSAAKRLGFEFGSTYGDKLDHALLGGKTKVLEFLGRVRPPRLLGNMDAARIGEMRAKAFVPVEEVEAVGEQEVVALSTSTGTFVAEGFATHNTYQRPGIQYFIWEATRRGIKVIAPRESCLFDMPKWKW